MTVTVGAVIAELVELLLEARVVLTLDMAVEVAPAAAVVGGNKARGRSGKVLVAALASSLRESVTVMVRGARVVVMVERVVSPMLLAVASWEAST